MPTAPVPVAATGPPSATYYDAVNGASWNRGESHRCVPQPGRAEPPVRGSAVLRPGQTYTQTTVHAFSTD